MRSCQSLKNSPCFQEPGGSLSCSQEPSMDPILSKINIVLTTHPIFLRSILILSTHLRLRLLNDFVPSGFPTNILYSPILVSYIPCPSHPTLDHSNYTWRILQITKLLVTQFSPVSCHFIHFRSKYSPQHPVLEHPQSMSPLNVWDRVSHPYRLTGKIIVLYSLIFKLLESRWEDRRFWTKL
jgi:hypothetical protein